MARRQLVAPKKREYELESVAECETSPKYDGLHLIEPTRWPPKAEHGEDRPYTSARCVHCGGWCIAYADNDPQDSGIEIAIPKKDVKEKVPA